MSQVSAEQKSRWEAMVQKSKVRKLDHNRAAAEAVNRSPAAQAHRPVTAPSGPSGADRAATAAALAKTQDDVMKAKVVKACMAMTGLRIRAGESAAEQFAQAEARLFVMGLRCDGMRPDDEIGQEVWRTDVSKIGARFENQRTLNQLLKS